MNIRHDPDNQKRDNERKYHDRQERLRRWLRTRPGNVRRAPYAEQVRQWQAAVIRAVFTPL